MKRATAKTRIDLWYGLKGYLGEQVMKVCDRFNAAQNDYEIVCTGTCPRITLKRIQLSPRKPSPPRMSLWYSSESRIG